MSWGLLRTEANRIRGLNHFCRSAKRRRSTRFGLLMRSMLIGFYLRGRKQGTVFLRTIYDGVT